MAGQAKAEIPQCPNCDTALKPERINAGRYLCPVCARVFTIPKS
jgi:ribosomal protein L37AE/L43A